MFPPLLHRRSRHISGFTLIEILALAATLFVLMTISVRVVSGVGQRAMAARARSQLTAIASALAQYKMQYGDYPQTEEPTDLFDALTGKLGPKLAPLNPEGKIFLVNLEQFNLSAPDKLGTSGTGNNALLDPWGNPYNYAYRVPAGGNWTNPNFILFSDGLDGKHKTPVRDSFGFPPKQPSEDDADNIYESEIR